MPARRLSAGVHFEMRGKLVVQFTIDRSLRNKLRKR
jgi:hypothetical protein